MAYDIPAGGVLEVQHRYRLQGQQCINVYHYEAEVDIPDAGAELPFIAAAFDLGIANPIQTYQTNECIDGTIRAQWVTPFRYVYFQQPMADTVGTAAPPTTSIGTSLVVRRRSERATRSARGRVYIGGIAQTYLTIGTWNSSLTTAIRDVIANAVKSTLVANMINYYPIIWSYADPVNKDRVVSAEVDTYARYQRRREVGRGE